MGNANTPIDIVILWVDGGDPEWRKDRAKYSTNNPSDDNRDFKFRDWDNLQYLFRGIDKFMPWVRKIHFVTYGHLPKWLNVENKKLNIVNHKDYMAPSCLPCFNSEALEINIHRISGLAENFIYFNDDQFLLQPLKSTDFFINDLPCDTAVLNMHCCDIQGSGTLSQFLSIGIINKHFDMKEVLKKNISKWFNLKYGRQLFRTLYLLPCPRFPGIWIQHLANSYKKSTFEEVWEKEYELLDMTSHHRFRSLSGVSQHVFKEWQICSGKFVPRKSNMGKSLGVTEIDEACKIIRGQQNKMICFNDSDISTELFENVKSRLNRSLNTIFSEKCSFEK